jgi:DNA ligase (NAD+)
MSESSESGAPAVDNPYVWDPPTEFEPVAELDREAAEAQAERLREAIRFHDRRYYQEADPVIDDRTYDRLFDRLEELEEAFDLDTEGSPTERVAGEPLDELESVEHVAPMLSVDSSGEPDGVREFDDRVRRALEGADWDGELRYVCEPKFDGVSVEVIYEEGVYKRAATRGDGEVGDDITRNVRTVGSVLGRLAGDHPEFLAVRGELFMPRDAFQEYNRELVERGEEPFANPRNATAGTVRQLDPSVVAERPLDCFFFDVLDSSVEFESHWERHRTLPEWGLHVDDRVERVEDVEAAIDYRDDLLAERDALDYEVDGVVIKVDDYDACEALGSTSRAPRWAFAYKFPARSEETTVRGVAVQVGRTGRLTPVALLDPVEVGGVTVSRATLHNPEQIAELDVNVGDRVQVLRSGDVIPYVEEVVEKNSEGHFEFPELCPVCGSAVEHDGPLAFCTGGVACDAQLQRAIEHYASRNALDIEGLGERRVDQLLEAGLIERLPDLYELDREELAELEGWGEASADNLIGELERSREPELADFLVAIGVPEVGPTVARDLARHFGSFDAVREAPREELREVEGIGEVVADEIREFFDSERNREVLAGLLEHVDPREVDAETGDALEGLTFVFTGALEGYTRSEAEELVERNGGSATSSVSGNTDYLVAGENPGGSKLDDADAEEVPALDREGFEELLRGRGVELG